MLVGTLVQAAWHRHDKPHRNSIRDCQRLSKLFPICALFSRTVWPARMRFSSMVHPSSTAATQRAMARTHYRRHRLGAKSRGLSLLSTNIRACCADIRHDYPREAGGIEAWGDDVWL